MIENEIGKIVVDSAIAVDDQRLGRNKFGFLLSYGEVLTKNGITRAAHGVEDEYKHS